jgi:hypothetical protein
MKLGLTLHIGCAACYQLYIASKPVLLKLSVDLRRPQAPAYGEQAVAVGVYGWGGEEFGGLGTWVVLPA